MAVRFKLVLVPETDEDARRFFVVSHSFDGFRRAGDPVVVPPTPLVVKILQSVQLIPICRICAEIGQFIRIGIQIEQHRPHFFHVYVFPPSVEYHREPGVVLIDSDGAAGFPGRVVVL